MDNESRSERQPVALQFLVQDGYAEDPQRLIEYEFLYIEKGRGTLFLPNSTLTLAAGDLISTRGPKGISKSPGMRPRGYSPSLP